jgi:hypothetical protein
MIVYDSIRNVVNFPEILWYIMAYYLDFVQHRYVLLTFPFPFGLFQNDSKFHNFRLGNGEIGKSQYRICLRISVELRYPTWSQISE